MKQMKTIRSLIVLLTAICFGLAVIAFFLPHGIGTVCAIGTVALAALVLILCLVYGALYFWPAPHRRLTVFSPIRLSILSSKSSAGLSVGLRKTKSQAVKYSPAFISVRLAL